MLHSTTFDCPHLVMFSFELMLYSMIACTRFTFKLLITVVRFSPKATILVLIFILLSTRLSKRFGFWFNHSVCDSWLDSFFAASSIGNDKQANKIPQRTHWHFFHTHCLVQLRRFPIFPFNNVCFILNNMKSIQLGIKRKSWIHFAIAAYCAN